MPYLWKSKWFEGYYFSDTETVNDCLSEALEITNEHPEYCLITPPEEDDIEVFFIDFLRKVWPNG